MAQPGRKTYDIATRAQVVTLKQYTSLTNDEIWAITGMSPRQVTNLNSKAVKRGYRKGQPLRDLHVCDAPRSGRPKKQRAEEMTQADEVEEGDEEERADGEDDVPTSADG